jgi:endonuclease/exonuclease/phosphatase family metal-dependent hydrolase
LAGAWFLVQRPAACRPASSRDAAAAAAVNTLFKPPTEQRWTELAAWIAAEGPDIVCLQECRRQGGRDVSSWLVSSLPDAWFAAFGGVPEGDQRTAALDGAAVREAQVLAVEEFTRSTADPASALPPVLAGDFNAGPRASAIAFLRGECPLGGRSAFYQDAWAVAGGGPGITWDHANPLTPPAYCYDARCDYIFAGTPKVAVGWSSGARTDLAPAGQVTAARIVCDRPLTGHLASDHYGVLAEICWPSRPGPGARPGP